MLNTDTPPSNLVSFEPGNWQQDLFLIPTEAALVYSVTEFANTSPYPKWPFTHETNTKERQPTAHPSNFALPFLFALHAPILTGLNNYNQNFELFTHIRGLIHVHLLTELATVSTKKWVGRHRPFYDTAKANNNINADDSNSFFSGHSAHAFATTVYASMLTFEYINNPWIKYTTSTMLMSAATWVASKRALDGQHHWSDIIIGSAIGTSISAWVTNLNIKTARTQTHNKANPVTFSVIPNIGDGANLTFNFQWKY